MINGISTAGLGEFVAETQDDPHEAKARYGVALRWQTGTRGELSALPMHLGAHRITRNFRWLVDEPRQLLGTNQGPNPQELLLSGVAGCLMVAYVVGASAMCIRLDDLSIEVRGALDLRGFLGTDPDASVAFESIDYDVHIDGDGTPEQWHALHQNVIEHSPNRMTIARGVPVRGTLHLASASAELAS